MATTCSVQRLSPPSSSHRRAFNRSLPSDSGEFVPEAKTDAPPTACSMTLRGDAGPAGFVVITYHSPHHSGPGRSKRFLHPTGAAWQKACRFISRSTPLQPFLSPLHAGATSLLTTVWRRPATGTYSNSDRKSTRLNSSHVAISYA